MNKLLTRMKHHYRNSRLAGPYWRRRHGQLLRQGTFAQHGEDNILAEMFPGGSTYIDIGANHPFLINNTYKLYLQGWRGVTVEPIRSLWRMHRRWRPHDIALNAAVGGSGSLKMFELYPDVLSTLSADAARKIEADGNGLIIAEYEVPLITGRQIMDRHLHGRNVDVLSVDVESFEFEVLQSFDFGEFRPSCILIEHHSFIPDVDGADRCAGLLTDLGYRCERIIGSNSIYVS